MSNPRDPMHDEPYAAAFVIKTGPEAARLVEAHSYGSFSDIFEENYFLAAPFHGELSLLNLYAIAKPIYRAYQLQRGDRSSDRRQHEFSSCGIPR